jgi:hypothetical protein
MGDRLVETMRRAAALGPEAFAPFDVKTAAADEIGLCLHWPGVPSGALPSPPAPYPSVPTLVLQGGEDLRTPPEGSARVAAAIAGAQRVVVPGVGHAVVGGDPSGCGNRALQRFLGGAEVAAECPRVGTGVEGAPLPPARLAAVTPVPGLPRRVGRTAGAIGVTVDDLVFSLSPAFLSYSGGGLRGGSFALRRDSVVVRAFEAVRGVHITGVAGRGALRLRVGGRAAATGRVTLRSGGRLRGRLGGHRVDVRLADSGPSALASGSMRGPGPSASVFRAPFAPEKSHPRLVPSPAR